ncbi:hypothetical protein B0E38_04744 [Streptomyces sp. 111WW2]|uniref:hypothetical protein n=1 Tax=Streptomyces sp. 111WW2 TaxID=1945515 RepID=UPI000D0C7C86|nr:hypothetical protein [Streptomyces sp. 111WW2]PSK52418.1 hypothetical protein B0E38_04744 [Streptomyces sp. 111WW2]
MTHLPILDRATGMHRSVIRWPDACPPPLDGCRWCGTPYLGHGSERYAASRGWHGYAEPTTAQMTARRDARRPVAPQDIPARTRCDHMNHDSVGREVFCEIEDPDHEEDHAAGDGITWPRED